MKSIDLIVSVKAEHTLRDAVRDAAENSQGDDKAIELSPLGTKDWIAGDRAGSSVKFGEVDRILEATAARLINLKSQQRIRRDSIRIYAVPKPVPVFREPMPESPTDGDGRDSDADAQTVVCPVCKAEVHRYNARYDSKDNIVGCFICRGISGRGDNR